MPPFVLITCFLLFVGGLGWVLFYKRVDSSHALEVFSEMLGCRVSRENYNCSGLFSSSR